MSTLNETLQQLKTSADNVQKFAGLMLKDVSLTHRARDIAEAEREAITTTLEQVIAQRDALLAELARTSCDLTEAKKEIGELQNVLTLAVDDQRMSEIMQDMVEWYGDAIKLLPAEKLADDANAQYYIRTRGISPKGGQ